MAGSTPVPFEGVSVLFYFSGNGYSSARIVHLTGEHFDIISFYVVCRKVVFCPKDLSKYKQANDSTDAYPENVVSLICKIKTYDFLLDILSTQNKNDCTDCLI